MAPRTGTQNQSKKASTQLLDEITTLNELLEIAEAESRVQESIISELLSTIEEQDRVLQAQAIEFQQAIRELDKQHRQDRFRLQRCHTTPPATYTSFPDT